MKPIFLTSLLTFLTGCQPGTGEFSQSQPPQPPVEIETSDRLNQIQQAVFSPICTQCHAGNQAAAGLRLDSTEQAYSHLVNVTAVGNESYKRVVPSDPDNSFLMLKILGDPIAGQRMPLGLAALSAENIELIRLWIAEGALPASANVGLVSLTSVVVESQSKGGISAEAEGASATFFAGQPEKKLPQYFKFIVGFSAAIDPLSISHGSIQIYAFENSHEYLLTADHYSVDVQNNNTAVIRLSRHELQSQAVYADNFRLVIGEKASYPLFDGNGNLLDINNNGEKGGTYEFEFKF